MARQISASERLAAVGWAALAIVCLYVLGQVDLRVSGSSSAFELVEEWVLLGRALLVVCIFHVVIHTYRTARELICEVRESWAAKP